VKRKSIKTRSLDGLIEADGLDALDGLEGWERQVKGEK